MDAIRFDPSIGGDIATGRRQSGGGGDMFADMLGDQLKQRADAERSEPAIRRRKAPERRPNADAVQGRPVRPIIKHPRHAESDGAGETQGQRRIAARDETRQSAACMDDQVDSGVDHTTRSGDDGQPDAAPPSAPVAADADADSAQQPVAIAALATNATATDDADGQTGGTMADESGEALTIAPAGSAPSAPAPEAVVPEAVTPEAVTAGGTAEAADDTASSEAAAAAVAESSATGFAETLDAAAAAMIAGGEATDSGSVEPVSLTTASLATLAAPQASATPAAGAAADSAGETADLTVTNTPEAPRPAEPPKPRPSRAAPAAEIKAQQSAPATPQPQGPVQAAVQAAQQAQGAGLGKSPATTPFDATFEGDGVAAPGWTLHLAQGAAAKRPDFIAQLRQHLQDLPAHEQVAVNIQRAIREGTGRLSIQLSPAELGQIHVKLEIDEDKRVTAAVTVEKPSTLELLQRDGKALERALHDAGLKMDGSDLSFSLGRHDGKEFSQDLRHSGASERGNGLADGQAEGELPTGPAAQVDTAAGLVNVQI